MRGGAIRSIDAKGIMYSAEALLDGGCFPFDSAQARPNCDVCGFFDKHGARFRGANP